MTEIRRYDGHTFDDLCNKHPGKKICISRMCSSEYDYIPTKHIDRMIIKRFDLTCGPDMTLSSRLNAIGIYQSPSGSIFVPDHTAINLDIQLLPQFAHVKKLVIRSKGTEYINNISADRLTELGVRKLTWMHEYDSDVLNIDNILDSEVTHFELLYKRTGDDRNFRIEGNFEDNWNLIKFDNITPHYTAPNTINDVIRRNIENVQNIRFKRTKSIIDNLV